MGSPLTLSFCKRAFAATIGRTLSPLCLFISHRSSNEHDKSMFCHYKLYLKLNLLHSIAPFVLYLTRSAACRLLLSVGTRFTMCSLGIASATIDSELLPYACIMAS